MTDIVLAQAAQDVLDVAAAALTGQTYDGATLVPSETYVTAGDGWARDHCSTLVVHVVSIEVAYLSPDGGLLTAALPAKGCVQVPIGNLIVTLTYCIPTSSSTGKPPDPDDVTAAALKLYAGAMTVWRGLSSAARDGTLLTAGGSAQIGVSTPSGPQGGRAGVEIPLQVTLERQVSEGS